MIIFKESARRTNIVRFYICVCTLGNLVLSKNSHCLLGSNKHFFYQIPGSSINASSAAMDNTVITPKATKQPPTTFGSNPSIGRKRNVDARPHQGEKVDEKYYFNVYTYHHNRLTAKGNAHASSESFKRPFVQTYLQQSTAMGRLYL